MSTRAAIDFELVSSEACVEGTLFVFRPIIDWDELAYQAEENRVISEELRQMFPDPAHDAAYQRYVTPKEQ